MYAKKLVLFSFISNSTKMDMSKDMGVGPPEVVLNIPLIGSDKGRGYVGILLGVLCLL